MKTIPSPLETSFGPLSPDEWLDIVTYTPSKEPQEIQEFFGRRAEKPTLPEPALNSLIDTPEKEVDSRIGRAMQCESYIPHIIVWYRCPMESYPHPFSRSAATARPRRASSRPPARPQPRPPPAPMACAEGVRLRPRLEEKGGHASLVVGDGHRLIKDEIVSCARHAKSESAK